MKIRFRMLLNLELLLGVPDDSRNIDRNVNLFVSLFLQYDAPKIFSVLQ
jgi:hypothetical protein